MIEQHLKLLELLGGVHELESVINYDSVITVIFLQSVNMKK